MVRDARVARMPRSDGRTLSSILSLAAGAAAIAPTGEAVAEPISQFHTTTFSPQSVGFGAGDLPSWSATLPGSAGKISIQASSNSNQAFIKVLGTATSGVSFGGQASTRSVNFPTTSLGNNVAFRIAPMLSGGVPVATASTPNWNDNGGKRTASLAAGIIVSSAYRRYTQTVPPYDYVNTWKGVGPGGFTSQTDPYGKYLLFKFVNSDLATPTVNYGWIHLVSVSRTVGDKTGMSAVIDAWAYRDDGAPIGAGQTEAAPSAIPEIDPSAATGALAAAAGALSLLEQRRRRGAGEAMGGALVSGAAGLRRWRGERAKAAAARTAEPAA